MSLMQADKFVKEGNFKAALEAIAQARQVDPTNPYAIAYEERVRTLMQAQQKTSTEAPGQNPKHDTDSSPHLEQISKLAIEQERISAAATSIDLLNASKRKQEEDLRQQQDEHRRAAIRSKVTSVLSRAQQYLERDEFGRALDELSRAFLLDPLNNDAQALEQRIRTAQEEANKKKETGEIRKAEGETRQRQEEMRSELERLQREQAEQRTREEEARHAAQKQKVEQYLQRSRDLLAESRIQDALNELTFVVVIDPLNEEARKLAEHIQAKKEQLRKAELEVRRRKEEAERKKAEAINAFIQKHIVTAKQLAATGAISEALRVITRAYVLDPMSEELQHCENTLIAAQEEAMRAAEAKRITEEEDRRRAEDESRRQREQEERERILQVAAVENEARRRENHERILHHLMQAQNHLAEGRFEGALSEVALAFLIDPFHEDVKSMEQRVLAARTGSNQGAVSPTNAAASQGTQKDADASNAIAGHIAEANRLCDQGQHAKALDELAKAFILDPLDESIQKCEEVIQKEFIQCQAEQRKAATQHETQNQPSRNVHLDLAKEFIAKQAFDDALAEVALGISMDPENPELRQLECTIWDLQKRSELDKSDSPSGGESDPEIANRERLIKIHMLAAEEFAKHNDVPKALDELAKAFVIDPLNTAVKRMEHHIRERGHREQNVPSQPLKLVYRGDKAAEA